MKYAEDIGDPLVSYMNSSYVPRSRQNIRLGWQRGDWAVNTSILRVGHMNFSDGTVGSPYFDTNLSVSYDITQDSYIGLQITNLFDAIPDSDLAYDNGSSFYPYGFNSFQYPRFGPSAYLSYNLKF